MESSKTNFPPMDRVDLSFRIAGLTVPLDHGYALFGAVARVLGDIHKADWLAIHPMNGVPSSNQTLALHPTHAALTLRVIPSQIPLTLALAGKTLELRGHRFNVGTPSVYALKPSDSLTARMVVVKGFTEPEPFNGAVKRKLEELGVTAKIEIGRRRIAHIANDRIVGFGLTLRELADEASLRVQYAGIGGRQRMGCGVFLPLRADSQHA